MRVASERNRLLMIWTHLHDREWFSSHLFWLLLKLAGSAATLDSAWWRAFGEAVGKLNEVRSARRKERAAAARSDREIDRIFRELVASEQVRVLRNVREYENAAPLESVPPATAGGS
jgi:hypothetical protein